MTIINRTRSLKKFGQNSLRGVLNNRVSYGQKTGPFAQNSAYKKTRQWIRQAIPLAIGIACLVVLSNQLGDMDMARILSVLAQVSLVQWTGAIAATAISFWAVGRYDAVIHRHWKTGYSSRAATLSGATSIALAQTIGLGVFSGAFARWRMMPDLGLKMATQISASVAISFLAAWSVITAVVLLCLDTPPIPAVLGTLIVVLPLLGGVVLLGCAFWRPQFRIKSYHFSFPTLPAIGAIFALTLLDTMAAAVALQFLLPETLAIGIQTLFPVFLIALGAALISGTPGGVGPFELTMLALLPAVPNVEIIGAILAFRLIYYALPACIAVVILARPPTLRSLKNSAVLSRFTSSDATAFDNAKRAETGVARQNGTLVFRSNQTRATVLQTGQSLNVLFDPICGAPLTVAKSIYTFAERRNKLFSIYKCTPRTAAVLRKGGYKALHIANEALINPSQFTQNTPAFRQLRRKLRKAEKLGVEVVLAPPAPISRDLSHEMSVVDDQWRDKNGAPRGATMGQFCPKYLAHQRVFLARKNGTLVGFISLHTSTHEHCLDLMRALPDAPDGTMHALVNAAIQQANIEGQTRFSLAALPVQNAHGYRVLRPILQPLHRAIIARSANTGLVQFKSCFNPRLQPLYMVAPSFATMAVCLADIARAVHFPDAADNPSKESPPQHDYDHFEIATAPNS